VARAQRALSVIVLAAGQGTRMRSALVKLLHPVAGRPMVALVLDAVSGLDPDRVVTVVGHQADRVREAVGDRGGAWVVQREQRGTGHAVTLAMPKIAASTGATVLIVNGDLPALRTKTLSGLIDRHRRARAAMTLVSAVIDDATGYGRIVRDVRTGEVTRIVEHRDATPEEKSIREINAGIYCAEASALGPALRRLRPDNAQGELYLTDAVRHLIERGERVVAIPHPEPGEVLGVNTRAELSRAWRLVCARKAEELQAEGVTLVDPESTWIDPRARIGRDTTIWPSVTIEGATVLGSDCVVRSGSRLTDCRVGRRVEIRDHSVIADSTIGDDVTIGPFAHLRPGSILEDGARIGNFVETKKTRVGRGSKANHLTYLGDAEIGPGCNIGAGTITCNYDGERKHETRLGRNVFVGSNTQIVAPVAIGDGAYVAAGSTVTQDVPKGALAIARSRQRNVLDWAARKSPPSQSKKKKAPRRRPAAK
jgi:bifunctional UDP-N-acetylglucosamine pyrophosphorylase/glucosamine-1-phosphate N-acetyltransferase